MTAPSRSRSTSMSGGLGPTDTGSLFDLSGHEGSRRGKIALVVALDLILVGAGVAMIWSYLSSRSAATENGLAAATSSSPTTPTPTTPPPTPGKNGPTAANVVNKGSTSDRTSPERASEGSDRGSKSSGSGSGSTSNTSGSAAGSSVDPGSGSGSGSKGPGSGSGSKGPGSGSGSSDPGSGSGSKGPGSGSGSSDPGSGSGSKGPGSGSGSSDPGSGSGSDDPGAGSGTDAPETEEEEVSRFANRIDGVVSRNQGALARCYAQAAKTHSPEDPLQGRVEIRFRILPDESVTRVKAQSNTSGSTVLASCLVTHVRTWRFPGGPSTSLDFVWPFRFRPKN